MADNSYKFKVEAETDSALNSLSQVEEQARKISELQSSLHNKGDFVSVSNMQEAIQSMRQLEQEAQSLLSTFDNFRSNGAGGNASILNGALDGMMNNARGSFNSISGMNINTPRGYTSLSRQQAANDGYTNTDSSYMDKLDTREDRSYMRRLSSRQSARFRSAMSGNRISAEGYDQFNYDNEQGLSNLSDISARNNDRIDSARTRISSARASINEVNHNSNIDEFTRNQTTQKLNDEITANTKLIESIKSFNSEIDKTTSKLKDQQSQMDGNSDMTVSARRGTFQGFLAQRAGAIGYHTVAGGLGLISSQYQQGKQLNSATDDTSINLAYSTNSANDQSIRNQMFSINQQRSNGYSLEDSLSMYQLAISRNGYSGGNSATNMGMVDQMEQAGNNTGIGRSGYMDYASSLFNAGAINNNNDLKSLDNSVTGMNVYARTQGMQQQQTQTLTSLVNQTSQDRTLSASDIQRLASVEGITAKNGGRSLQGSQGQQSLNQWDNSYIQASEGNNQKLLQMKIQSDPTKYGGLRGVVNAEKDLSKGLADPGNVDLARRMSDMYGGGKVAGALVMQGSFGVKSPKNADTIAKILDNGKLSKSEQDKAIKDFEKTGKFKRQENQSKYDNSSTAKRNQQAAEYEKRISQSNDVIEKTLGGMLGLIGGLPAWMTTIISLLTTIATTAGTQAAGSYVGSKIQDYADGKLSGSRSKFSTKEGAYKEGESLGGYSSSKKSARVRGRFGSSGRASFTDRAEASFNNTKIGGKARNLFGKVRDSRIGGFASSALEKGRGALGTASEFAGKWGNRLGVAGNVLAAGALASDVLSSKHPVKQAVRSGSRMAGGMAGWAGGAATGAALGSVIPGAGTLVGGALGLVGGIGGSLIGSDAFGKVGDFITGKGSNKSADNAQNYQDKEKEEANARARKDNIDSDSRQLDKAANLLNVSKAQNGIIGKNGTGTSSTSIKQSKSDKDKAKQNAKVTTAMQPFQKISTYMAMDKNSKKSTSKSKSTKAKSANTSDTNSVSAAKATQEGLNKMYHHTSMASRMLNQPVGAQDFSTSTNKSSNSSNKFDIKVNVNGDVKDGNKTGKDIGEGLVASLKKKMNNGIANNTSNLSLLNGLS
ncbi:hypothetical protein [Levilactobacillus phage ENFP1]|nr:hypothetical protein [Levilactobacillus phage ENFP1]